MKFQKVIFVFVILFAFNFSYAQTAEVFRYAILPAYERALETFDLENDGFEKIYFVNEWSLDAWKEIPGRGAQTVVMPEMFRLIGRHLGSSVFPSERVLFSIWFKESMLYLKDTDHEQKSESMKKVYEVMDSLLESGWTGNSIYHWSDYLNDKLLEPMSEKQINLYNNYFYNHYKNNWSAVRLNQFGEIVLQRTNPKTGKLEAKIMM